MSDVDDLLKGYDQVMASFDMMVEELNTKDHHAVPEIIAEHIMREAQIRNHLLRQAGKKVPMIASDLEQYKDTLAKLLKCPETG